MDRLFLNTCVTCFSFMGWVRLAVSTEGIMTVTDWLGNRVQGGDRGKAALETEGEKNIPKSRADNAVMMETKQYSRDQARKWTSQTLAERRSQIRESRGWARGRGAASSTEGAGRKEGRRKGRRGTGVGRGRTEKGRGEARHRTRDPGTGCGCLRGKAAGPTQGMDPQRRKREPGRASHGE